MRVWVAIWTGSSAISRGFGDWIRGGVLVRLVCVVLAAGFIKGLPFTTAIAVLGAVAWLLTAVYVGLRLPNPLAPAKKAAAEPVKSAAEEPSSEAPATAEEDVPKGPPGLPRDTVIEGLHRLLGESGGVHLKALAQALPDGPWTTGTARSLLASHSIRVRPGVRGPAGGVREGVHRDDIPALPSPDSEPPVASAVAAGQGNNNNGNNTEEGDVEERAFESAPDETNPARTHIRWRRGPRKTPA